MDKGARDCGRIAKAQRKEGRAYGFGG